MNNFNKVLITFLFLCLSAPLFSQRGMVIPDSVSNNFFKELEYRKRYWDTIEADKRKGGFKQFGRWQAFWEMRVTPEGEYPDPKLFLDAFNIANEQEKKNKADRMLSMPTWIELGPTENPIEQGSSIINGGVGRVNVIRFNPTNPQEVWSGSAFGGAWKSTNGGENWTPLYQTEFFSLGVSDFAISPSNPNIVYVATGDNPGALAGGGTAYSIGVLKTTDGGATWNTTGNIYTLRENRIIGRLWIHPENPDIVVAGGTGGIIKTTDGGATWNNVFSGTRIGDMEQMPGNPNVLYASGMTSGVIYRSDDMGNTWQLIRQVQGAGRTCIEVTPAAPNNLYALFAIPGSTGTDPAGGGFHSLLVSENRGDTWENTNIFATKRQNYLGWSISGNLNTTGGQGFYDLAMAVSPTNANTIFIGGINIWRSTDRGLNFSPVAYWTASQTVPYVHADIHDLVFVGNDLYAAHDGGMDVTRNLGSSWQQMYKGMGIGQIYFFNNSRQNPDKIIIGCQDLGTRRRDANLNWHHVGGGDGMGCAFNPQDDNRYYFSVYYGDVRRAGSGIQTQQIISQQRVLQLFGVADIAAFVTPLAVSPSGRLYVGFCNIYMSSNQGNNWSKQTSYGASSSATIRGINVSEANENYVYANTRNTIYYTDNALSGATWRFRNPPASGNISQVMPHPANPEMFYITISGYTEGSKLYKYDGEKWINLSGNLPNVPANCVAIHIDNGVEKIYVGTDIGVYYALEHFPIYTKWGIDLPNTCVSELDIILSKNILRAATFGRGIWETYLNNCSITENIVIRADGDTAICNRDSVRLYVETPNQHNIIWSTGATGNEIWVRSANSYYAASNTNSDCIRPSNTVDITIKQQNTLNVTTNGSVEMCVGDTLRLTATGGFATGTYMWNTNDTGRILNVTEAGKYVVSAQNATSDCISTSDTITVITYDRPQTPTITYISDATNNATKFDTLEASDGNRYQWYKNGSRMTTTLKRLVLERNNTGNYAEYTVAISNEGDCFSDRSAPYDYTTINEYADEPINISPNPAQNNINVKLTEQHYGEYFVSILDITGKTIKEFHSVHFGEDIEIFDINSLPNGTYLLKLVSDKYSISKHFVKANM